MDEQKPGFDLNGSFTFKIDAKGRMSLPAKFRKVLPNDLVITRSLDDEYLMVFDGQDSHNAWVDKIFVDKYGKFDSTSRDMLLLRSVLKGRACDVQVDSAGRVLLPAELREKVQIQKDAVIVGNSGYLEVWSAERRGKVEDEVNVASLLS